MTWRAAGVSAVVGLAVALTAAGGGVADERVEHYEGRAAATLEEAVANFSEYNARLATLLDKDALTPGDLEAVHELTYTLENALDMIRAELARLAETLEEVHVASEEHDADATRTFGAAYLQAARTVIP